jgi:hypothetical protein
MSEKKKRYFANHAKSSAAMISLGIHAVLLVIAVSFVAVTVITKEDQVFEAKPVNRPKMQLKKLQAPIKMEKKRKQAPKLRKRIVVQPRVNQNMPDIKMPEITGIKGGIGSGVGDGLGGGGGLGFSMPEINIFGVKGKGEKIFIILDSSNSMMVDEIGGIPAFELIKIELVKMLDKLNPTVLFNIGVYGGGDKVFFDKLVPASGANIEKAKAMIGPLNAVRENMRDTDYGTKTIGQGAVSIRGDFEMAPIKDVAQWGWIKLSMYAAQQNADSVFLLTQGWGAVFSNVGQAADFPQQKRDQWNRDVSQAKLKLKAENEQRKSRGQAPRVFINAHVMTKHYFPNSVSPPIPKRHYFRGAEVFEAMHKIYGEGSSKVPKGSGVKKKKDRFAFNAILFEKTDGSAIPYDTQNGGSVNNFKKITSLSGGDFRTLKGLKAIQGAASSD